MPLVGAEVLVSLTQVALADFIPVLEVVIVLALVVLYVVCFPRQMDCLALTLLAVMCERRPTLLGALA